MSEEEENPEEATEEIETLSDVVHQKEEAVEGGIKHVAYILYPKSEMADKVLIGGEPGEDLFGGEKYYDGRTRLEDGEFEWNGQTREIKEAGTFVDGKRLVSIFKSGSNEPVTYNPAKTFTAQDLKILGREETTVEGIQAAVGSEGSFSSSRTKSILVVAVLAVAIFMVFIILPNYIPALQNVPIFGW